MTSLDAARVIVEKLTAAGIRATTDPAALNLPAVLVAIPQRTYDLGCGYTALWSLHAISTQPAGWDHTAWAQLDALVDAIAGVYPVEISLPGTWTQGSRSYSSQLVQFTEVCD